MSGLMSDWVRERESKREKGREEERKEQRTEVKCNHICIHLNGCHSFMSASLRPLVGTPMSHDHLTLRSKDRRQDWLTATTTLCDNQ